MNTILPKACHVVVCMLVACVPASVIASDWSTVGQQGKTKLALDVESLELNVPAGVGKVWARTQFNPPSKFGDKKVAKLMDHYEVDCDTQKYAVLRSIAYDGAGEVVGSSDVPQQMQPTVPDTTAAVVVNAVCAVLSARKAANPSAR
ncbi:hypothetical protein P5W99_36530 [Paraburkholderia sp. A3BS-1L]|uniref:surface-adhesin E family protein n=1 Tax=Paraburkholderia sp. A3BS-1L TaxID=3028375 RepID=UPI003DA7B20A